MNYKNRTQSFSGIDTRKDINNPGIVYPLSKSDAEMVNVSSIVDHKTNKRTEIAHSEVRLFKNNENNLEYQKGWHTSIVIDDEKSFTFNEALKIIDKKQFADYTEKKDYIVTEIDFEDESFLQDLVNRFSQISYTPSVQFIKSQNLSKEEPKITTYNYKNPYGKMSLFDRDNYPYGWQDSQNNWQDNEEDEDDEENKDKNSVDDKEIEASIRFVGDLLQSVKFIDMKTFKSFPKQKQLKTLSDLTDKLYKSKCITKKEFKTFTKDIINSANFKKNTFNFSECYANIIQELEAIVTGERD